MLTKKQYELLMFIHERVRESGIAPSFDEMKVALDLKSKSGIHRLISALEERGFIRRLAHRARAIEILKLPDSFGQGVTDQAEPSPEITSQVIRPLFRRSDQSTGTVEVPVMGRIAAGTPIEALQEQTTNIAVPESMLAVGEHYALEVHGDSMIDAGIFDGDTVIIQRTNTAQNGDIIVALIEDQEATLKRLRRRGDSIALEAANPRYETRIYRPDQVQIQGKLSGLWRRY